MTEEQEIRIRERAIPGGGDAGGEAIISEAGWTPTQRRHLEEFEACLLLLTRLTHAQEQNVQRLVREGEILDRTIATMLATQAVLLARVEALERRG